LQKCIVRWTGEVCSLGGEEICQEAQKLPEHILAFLQEHGSTKLKIVSLLYSDCSFVQSLLSMI
jgi:hypothetical protein